MSESEVPFARALDAAEDAVEALEEDVEGLREVSTRTLYSDQRHDV